MTLKELTTITAVEYLFEIINEQSDDDNDTQYCILSDTSTQTTRFNEFTIEDTVDVTFTTDGFYTYNVYEQADGSGNLDPSGLNNVEKGRIHVYTIGSDIDEYTDATQSDKIYQE